jgi:hypothetical protein
VGGAAIPENEGTAQAGMEGEAEGQEADFGWPAPFRKSWRPTASRGRMKGRGGSRGRLGHQKLVGGEFAVERAGVQEFVVRADGHDAAAVQDDDLV